VGRSPVITCLRGGRDGGFDSRDRNRLIGLHNKMFFIDPNQFLILTKTISI